VIIEFSVASFESGSITLCDVVVVRDYSFADFNNWLIPNNGLPKISVEH